MLSALLPSFLKKEHTEQQLASRDIDPDRMIPVSIMLNEGNHHEFANLGLMLSEWRLLKRHFETGARCVSTSALEHAGFAKGANGSARLVNRALTHHDAEPITTLGKWRKPMAIEKFAAWVMSGEFENLQEV